MFDLVPFSWSGLLTTVLMFLIPGSVILKASDVLRGPEPKMAGERFTDIFLWSLLNWGLNTPLFFLARFYDIAFYSPILNGLFALWVFFICPVLVALTFSKMRSFQPQSRATARAFPTAWDFFFARHQSCWVLCHFKNGSQIGGYFGPNSSATSYPREPELFLEELWRVDENGRFVEKLDSAGAIVRGGECLWIEFFDNDANLRGQLRPARPAGHLWRDTNGNAAFSYAPASANTAPMPPQGKIETLVAGEIPAEPTLNHTISYSQSDDSTTS